MEAATITILSPAGRLRFRDTVEVSHIRGRSAAGRSGAAALVRALHDPAMMARLRPVLLVAGIALLIWLVLRIGPAAIASSLTRVAWWELALICLVHGVAMAVDTLGWRYAFARDRVPFSTLLAARTAGEAVNVVTALASVGGEAVKAWLLKRDVPYEESVPAVIAAKTATVVAQALFLLLGIVVAFTLVTWRSPFMSGMLWLLVVETLAVAGFLATQLTGVIARAGRLLGMFGLSHADGHAARLDRSLRDYYRRHAGRFLLSIGWHAVGCLVAVVESFLVMRAVGVSTSLAAATVVDALGSGIRFATFFVPASVGALEGANAAAFAALGFGAGAGLAYSLVRRARQAIWIAIGIVILAIMRTRRPEAGPPKPAAPTLRTAA
jgi:uncharacterized protein (TIRG00374 family)